MEIKTVFIQSAKRLFAGQKYRKVVLRKKIKCELLLTFLLKKFLNKVKTY